MPAEQLEWVRINDFKPGIFDVPSPDNPLGAATRDNTYRCIADHNGALRSMPKRVSDITITDREASAPADSKYMVGGMRVNDPIFDGTTDKREEGNNSEVWVGLEWFTGASDNDRELEVLRRKEYASAPSWQSILTDLTTRTDLYDANYRPARCQFEKSRSNHADNTDAGTPVVVFLYGDSPIFHEFPDDGAAGTTSTQDLPLPTSGNPRPSLMVAHQGRIIAFPLTLYGAGASTVYATNELLYWTEVNDLQDLDPELGGEFYNVNFGYENPTGYQCAASLTANELLLLKSRGGALAITGSINNPTVRTLQNVMSPGHSNNLGVQTPLGYAYCVLRGGVWVWGGGDASENISVQLKPDFWKPTTRVGAYGRPHTTCGMWRDWLIVPSNWLFDTIHQGWWRIEQTSDRELFHADSDWTGQYLYCAPHTIRHGQADSLLWKYDRNLGALSYSWESHPLPQTVDRQVDVREVLIVLSGSGTVVVNLDSAAGEQDQVSFTVASDYPVGFRAGSKCKGYNVQVRIESTGDGGNTEYGAPTVHEVAVGFAPRQKLGIGQAGK